MPRGRAGTGADPLRASGAAAAHEYVAEQIRRQVVLRLIPAGQALPPERDLAAIFGVGRATVQQAIRLLVDDGMVESRRGRYRGGNFVVGQDESGVGMEALLMRLRRRAGEVEEALAYREAIEPAAARLAARGRSREQLRSLRRANAAARGQDRCRVHAARHRVPSGTGRCIGQPLSPAGNRGRSAPVERRDDRPARLRSLARAQRGPARGGAARCNRPRWRRGGSRHAGAHRPQAQSIAALLSAVGRRSRASKRAAVDRRRAAG